MVTFITLNQTIIKLKLIFATGLLACSLFILSCGGKDKKGNDKTAAENSTKSSAGTDEGMVPTIDATSLIDEASILVAMQKVADATIADDKKQKEDPAYSGHYLELTTLYTSVLKAATAYSKTLTDPAKAIEFSDKFSAIQKKMYAK